MAASSKSISESLSSAAEALNPVDKLLSRGRQKGREQLERYPEEVDDVGFWGRVEYFLNGEIDPYSKDVDLYDHIRYESRGGRNVFERQTSRFVEGLEELGAEEGDTIMEVGASTSKLSGYLSGEDFETISLDFERPGQEIAREKDRSDNQIQADATNLPYKDNAVDYIVAPRVMHVVDDPKLISEINRVAEKGIVFDYFREGSVRDEQSETMNAMESSVHNDEYISDEVERITGHEPSIAYDFGLPYAAEIPWNNRILTGIVDKMQDIASYSKDRLRVNTVGYVACETSG